jgi:uncharacterized protein involved in high-affinity Fe2+ transport
LWNLKAKQIANCNGNEGSLQLYPSDQEGAKEEGYIDYIAVYPISDNDDVNLQAKFYMAVNANDGTNVFVGFGCENYVYHFTNNGVNYGSWAIMKRQTFLMKTRTS